MKAFLPFLSSLFVFFTVVHSQSSSTTKPTIPQTIPPNCAVECFARLIPQSVCAPTDRVCLCTNSQLLTSIAVCAGTNCTIREQLTTQKYSQEFCGAPIVDNTRVVAVAGLVGGSLALLAFGLRVLAKVRRASDGLGLEDLCLLTAVLISIPFTAFSAVLANKGLGRDIWEVPFDNITYILYIYFWDELIYVTVIPLTKMSILFFYLRVFPNKAFRRTVYCAIAFNFAFCVVYIIISVFQCLPVEGAWTRWDGTFTGKCNNVNMQGWMNAAINLSLDIFTLVLPMPLLYKLSLSFRKKAQIFLMFSVGFFVTIVSILRLHTLFQFANSTNFTQDYVPMGYWTTIEVHVGIICACMPAIRQLLRQVFPSVLGTTSLNSVPTNTSVSDQARASSKAYMHAIQSSVGSGKLGLHDDRSSSHALVELGNQQYYGIAV